MRPALKSGAVNDARRPMSLAEFLQCVKDRTFFDPQREVAIKANKRVSEKQRVLIAEKIGHQRHIAAAAG